MDSSCNASMNYFWAVPPKSLCAQNSWYVKETASRNKDLCCFRIVVSYYICSSPLIAVHVSQSLDCYSAGLFISSRQNAGQLIYEHFNSHIKTSEQWTIIQQYGDRYTGRWWVGCQIWYSEEGPGWAGAQSPVHCTKCNSPPINGQCANFILFDVAI